MFSFLFQVIIWIFFLINFWKICLFNGSFQRTNVLLFLFCFVFFAPIIFYSLFLNFCFYQFFFPIFPGLNILLLASLLFVCCLMNGIQVVSFLFFSPHSGSIPLVSIFNALTVLSKWFVISFDFLLTQELLRIVGFCLFPSRFLVFLLFLVFL